MTEQIIITTPSELRGIISEEVGKVLPKLADFRRKNEAAETDAMTPYQAAEFLTAQGVPSTRGGLYNLIFKNAIPYKKVGRRTVFSKKELLSWIESKTTHGGNREQRAALRLTQSANRKM